ncbi:hypothetical protein A2U01_0093115, partial [Trifolium medium]|nr:hypothetical protein [Trifolium medium]
VAAIAVAATQIAAVAV